DATAQGLVQRIQGAKIVAFDEPRGVGAGKHDDRAHDVAEPRNRSASPRSIVLTGPQELERHGSADGVGSDKLRTYATKTMSLASVKVPPNAGMVGGFPRRIAPVSAMSE